MIKVRILLGTLFLNPEGGNVVQKWEYKILNVEKAFYSNKADEEIEKALNVMGKEGWELVGYVTFKVHMLAFKRPVQ